MEFANTQKILELGAGSGGPHLKQDSHLAEYYLVDNDQMALKRLVKSYPQVKVVLGSAQTLPFGNNVFDRIEIRFPFRTLLVPGLQSHARYTIGFKSVLDHFCPPSEGPYGYQELHRVLKPDSLVKIWGDSVTDPNQISHLSSEYFELVSIKNLSIEELDLIKTETSEALISEIRIAESRNLTWEPVTEITLKSKPQG